MYIKKATTIIAFFLITLPSFSQTKNIVIADATDKSPLPFATIKILNKNAGYYSDKNGMVSILNQQADSLLAEYTGYQSRSFLIDIITDTIFLNRKPYNLSPVVIKSMQVPHKLGRFKYNKNNTIFFSESTEYALKIDLSEIEGAYKIKQLFLPVGFNEKNFNSTTLKIHLYTEAENGQPGQDILTKPIFIQKDYLLNKDFYIDISSQNIFLSEKSLFIGIECIIDKTSTLKENTATEKTTFKTRMKTSPITLYISSNKQFFNNSFDHTFFRALNSKTYQWFGGNSNSTEPLNFTAGLVISTNQQSQIKS